MFNQTNSIDILLLFNIRSNNLFQLNFVIVELLCKMKNKRKRVDFSTSLEFRKHMEVTESFDAQPFCSICLWAKSVVLFSLL